VLSRRATQPQPDLVVAWIGIAPIGDALILPSGAALIGDLGAVALAPERRKG